MSGPLCGWNWSGSDELRIVVFTDYTSVDDPVPVAGHQPVVTVAAREAVEMVHDVPGNLQHELTWGDRLAASRARPGRAEQPATDKTLG